MSAAPDGLRRAGASLALAACCVAGLLVQVAPMDPLPASWTPDLFWGVLALFAMRRHEAARFGLVFALVLLHDALVGGPFGASALTMLLGAEALRLRARVAARTQKPPRMWEDWIAASLVYGAALAAQWLLLVISFAPRPALVELAPHWIATALALPVLAALLRPALGPAATERTPGVA